MQVSRARPSHSATGIKCTNLPINRQTHPHTLFTTELALHLHTLLSSTQPRNQPRPTFNPTFNLQYGCVLGLGSMGTRVCRGEHEDWGAVAVKVRPAFYY